MLTLITTIWTHIKQDFKRRRLFTVDEVEKILDKSEKNGYHYIKLGNMEFHKKDKK